MTSQVKPRNFNNIDNTNLDYQWYNTSVYNDTGSDLIARYDEIRTYPYLDHIEDYEYTITRFKVPSYNFPLLELTNLAPAGHSLDLWVTMQDYNTIINNPGAPARVFHREPLLFPSTTGKYQIFDIQTVVNAVNDALNLCYAGITAAWNVNHQGDPPITLAERVTEPVIRLDPNNNKFYIATLTEQNQESVYYPSVGGNDNKFIVVSFSPALYSYFHGFATTSISNEKYRPGA